MKKTLSLALLLLALRSFACTDSTASPQWSLGIIGYGHLNMPYSGMQNYFMPGIQVGHNNANGKWSQRFAVEFSRHDIEAQEPPPGSADIPYVDGYEKQFVLRAGVERGWNIHQLFRPYVAFDVAGRFNRSDIYSSGGFSGRGERNETNIKSIGLIPAVGFKTFFGKHIALYAEYRAEAYMNNTDIRKTTYQISEITEQLYGPITFDLNAGSVAIVGLQVAF